MNIEQIIASKVKQRGGNTYYVGGYVRDQFLGTENKDIDIEVHGIQGDVLYSILQEVGKPMSFGKNFGIYSLREYNLDIALPRSEINTGRGHRDFEIFVDPYIGTKKAIERRDFTINGIYKDVLSGQIIDPFNGVQDIKNKVIRYIDKNKFSEDPLRVLRACQFASRFNFVIDDDTIELCKKIDLSTLSKERVQEELKKALTKGIKPSIFFTYLKQMHQLGYWFKEVEDLIDLKQDAIYHPEGDVFVHTMQVLDKTVLYRSEISNDYYFVLAALCHDFGKLVASEEIDGRIHAYKHEELGLPIINKFLKRITNEKELNKYVLNMAKLHMRPASCIKGQASIKATNKLFDEAIAPKDLIYFTLCDSNADTDNADFKFLLERYQIYEEMMSKPYVTGQDLIESGLKPNEDFNEILTFAHKLRLAGIEKKQALTQTLAYAHKLSKKTKAN